MIFPKQQRKKQTEKVCVIREIKSCLQCRCKRGDWGSIEFHSITNSWRHKITELMLFVGATACFWFYLHMSLIVYSFRISITNWSFFFLFVCSCSKTLVSFMGFRSLTSIFCVAHCVMKVMDMYNTVSDCDYIMVFISFLGGKWGKSVWYVLVKCVNDFANMMFCMMLNVLLWTERLTKWMIVKRVAELMLHLLSVFAVLGFSIVFFLFVSFFFIIF